MSDCSKMGLFGSKDKNQEQNKDSTKNETSGSYGPYCIDSESETYDTETLSIMDINDIIGVQSEPVGDSTLESEIAALSEIITESKVEDSQALSGGKSDLQDDVLSIDQECFALENVESMNSVSDLSEKVLEGNENVCNNDNVMDSFVSEQLSMSNNESNNENNVLESMLCDQVNVANSEVKDNCDASVSKESLCIHDAENEKSDIENQLMTTEDTNVPHKTAAETKELIETGEAGVTELKGTLSELNPTEQNRSKVQKHDSKTIGITMENISEVSSSLQLIEEAYTSEDSQDTNSVEPTTKEADEVEHASDSSKMPKDVVSSETCQEEDDTIGISESKLEDGAIAISESKLEDAAIAITESKLEDGGIVISASTLEDETIAISESKLEDAAIAMSESQLEDGAIAMSESQLEDGPITMSEGKLKESAIAMSTSKLEDGAIAISESKLEDAAIAISESKLEDDAIALPTSKLEDGAIVMSDGKLEESAIAMSESKLEDAAIAMSESKFEDGAIAMSEGKLEESAIGMSENKLEDDAIAISERKLEDDAIAMSESKLEDDTIAKSLSKLEDDTIPISESKLEDAAIGTSANKLEDGAIAVAASKLEATETHNCTDNEDKGTEQFSMVSEGNRDMLNMPEMIENNTVENKDNVLIPSEEQTSGEDISTSTTNMEEGKDEICEGMEVSEPASPEQSIPISEPMEVDKPAAETCTEKYVQLERNTMEENKLENSEKVEAADEELTSEGVATDERETQSVPETNSNSVNDSVFENNTSKITVERETTKTESVDAIDDCNMPQDISTFKCLQTREETTVEKLDAEELHDESLKLINQFTTETNAHLKSEEQPMDAVKPDIELSMKMENSVNETLNTIDNIVAEIDTNINAAENQNLDVTESQIDSNEFNSENSAEEDPVSQPMERSPLNSGEVDIKKIDLAEECRMDVKEDVEESTSNTTENTSEGELPEKVDNEVETQVEASCDILIQKPEESVPEEVLEEANEVIENIEEEISDSQKESDSVVIPEPRKEVPNLVQEKCGDTNAEIEDSKEDDEEKIREEMSSNKELNLEKTAFPSLLENPEDASNIPNENNMAGMDIVAESGGNAKSAEQVDTKMVGVRNDAPQNQISNLSFLRKQTVSPQADHADIVVPEEDAVEEHIEEEMNLTLDPEESDMQEEDQSSQSEILEKDTEKDFSNSNTIERILGEDESMQMDLIQSIKENNTELENIEETSDIEKDMQESPTLLNPEISMLSKTPEEPDTKEDSESNSQTDIESNNLKSILETANNVHEMFSEEQCQNTQDIVKSILDDVGNVTDFKNILETEGSVDNEIENVLQQSADLPLVESEMDDLTEKIPESSQNMDSLEGLLGLDLLPESEDSGSKTKKLVSQEQETLDKEVDMALLLEQSNPTSDIAHASDYITDVISSCLTITNNVPLQDNTNKADIVESINDKPTDAETSEALKADEDIISESINTQTNIVNLSKDLEVDNGLPENDLDMDFEENPLESVADLEETESKLELTSDILLQNVDQGEHLNDPSAGIETSQPSSEISELESAVKFLQESEEQAMDSPLVLSPKLVESVVDDISKQASASSLFVTDDDICEDTSELVAELQDIATDSISISEAEIISEAAKLETERKLAQQAKITASTTPDFEAGDSKLKIIEVKSLAATEIVKKPDQENLEKLEIQQSTNVESRSSSNTVASLPQNVLKISESIPKTSILEERLKVPPKIEIPSTDISKVCISPTTSKDSLLIQRDSKMMAYQRMLESPKLSEKSEPKIMDTPRKDSEKHDFENVGSPRIILKIAKSAIADCGEPRSPKSPKIRSAANSPNPEDSPGQKLGKIKLKLSKGGHPSIISNENIEETGQWYSEGGSSLSPLGMKIKLSKSGDASIVSSEKHESTDDCKETKHKFEEAKRTESPIGMKIKLSKSGDASIVQQDSKETTVKHKEKLEIMQGSPKRTESPIGMKIKLSKTGDASIIQDFPEEHKENTLKTKDMCYDSPKRTDSPLGMILKLSKTGDVSIVPDVSEEGKERNVKLKEKMDACPETPKRTDSPIGMKIKLTKTKDGASIVSLLNNDEAKEKLDIPDIPKRTESPLGMKIKLSKTGDASIIHSEVSEDSNKEKSETVAETSKSSDNSTGVKIKVAKSTEASPMVQETAEESTIAQESQKVESPIGMKIKLSKTGDASIVPAEQSEQMEEHKNSLQDTPKRTESPIGMKIKLSKSGDASIIQTETSDDASKLTRAGELEQQKSADSPLGMKIKLLKTGDASIVESEKKDRQQKRRDTESPLEMKIKLSKTGHPTIIACESLAEPNYKPKDVSDPSHNFSHRYKESTLHKEPALKILKSGHSTILQSNRAELTIEPIQLQSKKTENTMEISPKRKEITISPIEPKKSKLETQLSQILPEVTIQPVMSRDQKQLLFDSKTSLISRQQMNVISQEISITQVRPTKPSDTAMSEKLKDILTKNVSGSPMGSDCEIIEHRPELIIVNENSNSSQDVMIIEELSSGRMPEVKVPKKRGRPRRNPMAKPVIQKPPPLILPKDPLALDEPVPQPVSVEHRENERPKRTCRNQKSYAPPKRGRGRGRGKRKLDNLDGNLAKKPRIEQDLSAIEASTMAVITVGEPSAQQDTLAKSSELYKALKQPPMDSKNVNTILANQFVDEAKSNTPNSISSDSKMQISATGETSKIMPKPLLDAKDKKALSEVSGEKTTKTMLKPGVDEKTSDKDSKDMLVPPGHSNWLTPTSKRQAETSRHENVSTVQVIDEETRMSAESGSRSQTPARNISAQASENIVNEESQGSVLSTATTESEKVKVKNRRMEINFDPDEGPFTVDKIAEYEWPLDRKGETFMIQEQISQYLGVKSFKRKYPDLKRRMVDMEERNYLRENGLVSEAMCDMGLTAVCSSEVLDVMCGDFPDQYEEYRKHMREKQVKEHSKKQKELTAAANAEKNRIDLAEMAVQSALSWNVSLNKARKETRKCSLDLQTFTIHVPKKQQKVEAERKVSHYPVALIPGQYTDYYREYTAAELRYYPLNTVLYGPMRPNERKLDSQSEGSQSDSDSDSSSDDSSSSSSEGTQDTEGSQSTMDDVDMEIVNQKDEIKLKCKMCLKTLNKLNKNEILIQCGTCNGNVHPSCIDLTLDMVPHIQSYAWQCTDCKTCAQCHDPADEDKMLFCDMCDRGYHIYCVGLRRVPQGRWHCQECAVCANCSSREPGGMNSDRNSVAQWQHEYKKGEKNTRVYVSTLCVPCSKLWRKGRYCPHCSRCHTAPRLDLEPNLVHCSACDKYLHLGCVEIKGAGFDKKNYSCDFCTPNRQQVVKPLVSKVFKT